MDVATNPTADRETSRPPALDFEAARIYADYLEARMADELKVMDSLTQRGVAVITTAGALVALLLAARSVTLGTNLDAIELSEMTKLLAGLGIIGFVIAACLGLAANSTRPKDPPDVIKLRDLDEPSGDKLTAVGWVIQQRLVTLRDWYSKNTTKAKHLRGALLAETIAVGLLAGAVLTAALGV